ncbi:TPA: hypothetical protein ACGN8S_005258 [Bacillus cereus]
MLFDNEYKTLQNSLHDDILEIVFTFNSSLIKVYFSNHNENKFLILIIENKEISIIKNYGIFFKDEKAYINGYMGKYHKYTKNLQDPKTYKYEVFYQTLSETILNLNIPNPNVTIRHIPLNIGISEIKNSYTKNPFKGEAIYYHYISRKKMSPTQFKKICNSHGTDVAIYLKKQGLNAVFTPDISKQKKLILEPDSIN